MPILVLFIKSYLPISQKLPYGFKTCNEASNNRSDKLFNTQSTPSPLVSLITKSLNVTSRLFPILLSGKLKIFFKYSLFGLEQVVNTSIPLF